MDINLSRYRQAFGYSSYETEKLNLLLLNFYFCKVMHYINWIRPDVPHKIC